MREPEYRIHDGHQGAAAAEDGFSASLGKMVGAVVCFDECLDVPKAGVLCALPALLANGLLNGAKQFLGQVKGYYTTCEKYPGTELEMAFELGGYTAPNHAKNVN